MAPSASTALDGEDYRRLAYYDRSYPSAPVEEQVQIAQTLVGSGSCQAVYTRALVDLFGLAETSSVSTPAVELVVAKPTDEELWLSLVGIFASGDPHFAEQHDEIYGQRL